MNDNKVKSLEELFYQKIMLYDDLLNCFKRERESLMNIDMENLWTISEEKEELGLRIKTVRQEIISISGLEADQKSFNAAYILDTIPDQKRPQFQRLHMAIITLKDEIEVLRKENMNFIDDSLRSDFYSRPGIRDRLKSLEDEVLLGTKSSFHASLEILELYRQDNSFI